MTMSSTGLTSCSSTSEPRQSKEELWAGCLERPVGDGAVVQMIGLESSKHIVYARVIPAPGENGGDNSSGEKQKPQVTVLSAVQTMVDEGRCFRQYIHVVETFRCMFGYYR